MRSSLSWGPFMGSWSFLYGSRAVFLDLEADPHLFAELEPQIRDMCLLRVRDHAACRCRGREDGEGKGWSREGGEGREDGAGLRARAQEGDSGAGTVIFPYTCSQGSDLDAPASGLGGFRDLPTECKP